MVEGNCHEAAARHYELAASHHRAAAERAADGDMLAAKALARVATLHAVRGHRYAIRAGVPRDAASLDGGDVVDDD